MAKQTNSKQKYTKPSIPVSELGKVPPQALEFEEAVLGAIMVEKDAIILASEILKPESFYKESHQTIFKSILDLSTRLEPIDLFTVTEELRKQGKLEEIGGPVYLANLTNKVSSAAHIEYHSKIIAQKYIQRELIRVSTDIQNKAFEEDSDVDELLDYSEMELFKVAEGNIKSDTLPINQIVVDAFKQIEEAGKREDGLSGVPSGFSDLDRLTSGWQRSDLIIVAARPSMGKTAFVLSMARNMAVDQKAPVALFSLEMSNIQLVNRLLVSESGLASEKIRNGKLSSDEWTQLTEKTKKLSDAEIYIDDTPALSIFEFRAKCRRLKTQHDIGIAIIDYLQLMTGPAETKGNREQEVSTISRSLKAIAKELDIPIIALSQLNRSVETRGGNKRPQLSDLRESGAIEQDADVVIFIHRPEYYGFDEDDNGNSTKGLAEIIVAKHRNGAVDDIKLRFQKEMAKFSDYDDTNYGAYEQTQGTYNSSQSVTTTFSSKMNNDAFERGGDFNSLGPGSDNVPF
ncbi:MAG: replicative DNA helicase [Bacteroidales bacterium]|nr:replicative DNA helicase [Bacteroidales bacterium]HPD94757.1 replicative DNA helicase [Tenuifilaceae bacterium]HRX32425.1 replicative DNA helicase [Tenuifilaceae bacterium]